MNTGSAILTAYTRVRRPPMSDRYQKATGTVLRFRFSLTIHWTRNRPKKTA